MPLTANSPLGKGVGGDIRSHQQPHPFTPPKRGINEMLRNVSYISGNLCESVVKYLLLREEA